MWRVTVSAQWPSHTWSKSTSKLTRWTLSAEAEALTSDYRWASISWQKFVEPFHFYASHFVQQLLGAQCLKLDFTLFGLAERLESTTTGLTVTWLNSFKASYVSFREECKNQTQGHPNARYKRFNTLREAEDFVHGSISSFPLLPQKSHSDVGVSSTPKGQKRVYAEMDWDVVYSDGACKGNGNVGSVAGVGVWWGHNDPRSVIFSLCWTNNLI
jgi:hypothetical protein